MNTPDFKNLLQQFKDTEDLQFIGLVRIFSSSPDEHFYEIETNKGPHYIFEVDYISDFTSDVIRPIKRVLHADPEFYLVKKKRKFETSGPKQSATVYKEPDNWNEISMYANDSYGSYDFYFNFLFTLKQYENKEVPKGWMGSSNLLRK